MRPMRASQFFKRTLPVYDSYEIVRQCARCGRFDSHEDTCIELVYEQQRQDEAIRAAMAEREKGELA